MAHGASETTLYTVLGVDIKATQSTIRMRYLKLAKTWHPDRHRGSIAAKKRFQEIVSAFKILSDVKQRQQYDLGLLDLLDIEDYLHRFQGLILTVSGLDMPSGGASPAAFEYEFECGVHGGSGGYGRDQEPPLWHRLLTAS